MDPLYSIYFDMQNKPKTETQKARTSREYSERHCYMWKYPSLFHDPPPQNPPFFHFISLHTVSIIRFLIYYTLFLHISTHNIYIYISIHTYIYLHTYIHTCIHTYIHTYIHIYLHRYMYIYIFNQQSAESTEILEISNSPIYLLISAQALTFTRKI